jgi:hypothetical protein
VEEQGIMRKITLGLVVMVLSAGSASAQGWADKMFEGKLSHDFGTVARGAQLVHRFTITNIYAVRMEITAIKPGCACVTYTADKRVLQPKEATTIEIRMDARRFAGAKTVKILVSVGPDFISTAELKVSATSRADVVLNPGEVNFGNVTRGQASTQSVDVEYAGTLDWKISEVLAKDVPYTATIKEIYRRTGQVGYRLAVTLKEDAPAGAQKHELFLKTNDPASPLVSVLVEANVQTSLTVTPSKLPLGEVKANAELVRRVVLKGAKPFKVTSIEGTGEGIQVNPWSGEDAAVQTVTFNCKFEKAGPFKRELKIVTTLQETPVVVTIEGNVK